MEGLYCFSCKALTPADGKTILLSRQLKIRTGKAYTLEEVSPRKYVYQFCPSCHDRVQNGHIDNLDDVSKPLTERERMSLTEYLKSNRDIEYLSGDSTDGYLSCVECLENIQINGTYVCSYVSTEWFEWEIGDPKNHEGFGTVCDLYGGFSPRGCDVTSWRSDGNSVSWEKHMESKRYLIQVHRVKNEKEISIVCEICARKLWVDIKTIFSS